jgi:hypothetical protein
MARDLTRADLRRIVTLGLERTKGNYRLLLQLFNMSESDYKRFLNFLRKYQCQLPFQSFRVIRNDKEAEPGVEAQGDSTKYLARSSS